MEAMNIVDYKSQLDSLTGDLVNEYMKIETMYLREKSKSTSELIDMNKMNSSVTGTIQSKIDEITGLEKEIQGHRSREQEYIQLIDNLRSQLEELRKEEIIKTDINKFDMLRSQAKEITCKDKEIIRLNKEVERLKSMNDMKNNLSMVIEDTTKQITGWPPISSSIPNKNNLGDISLDTPNKQEPVDNIESGEEEVDEEEFFEISYRKKKYYRDSENKVYEIVNGDDVGDYIGDWIKADNGKYKLVKS